MDKTKSDLNSKTITLLTEKDKIELIHRPDVAKSDLINRIDDSKSDLISRINKLKTELIVWNVRVLF